MSINLTLDSTSIIKVTTLLKIKTVIKVREIQILNIFPFISGTALGTLVYGTLRNSG